MALIIRQGEKYLGLTLESLRNEVRNYYPEKIVGVFWSTAIGADSTGAMGDLLCIEWSVGAKTNTISIDSSGVVHLQMVNNEENSILNTTIPNSTSSLDKASYSLIDEWLCGQASSLEDYNKITKNNAAIVANSPVNNNEEVDFCGETQKNVKNLVNLSDYKKTKIITNNVIPLPIKNN